MWEWLPVTRADPPAFNIAPMRITVLRQRMAEEFGTVRADHLSEDYVFSGLGGRTVNQAIEDGQSATRIWQEVCSTFGVPEQRR